MGTIAIYLSDELEETLKKSAKRSKVSVSAFIAKKISENLISEKERENIFDEFVGCLEEPLARPQWIERKNK